MPDTPSPKMVAVQAAMDLAEDIATGKLPAAQLDAIAVDECRRLAFTVAGPDDPLWPHQVEVARQVLAVGGGIGADELAEWAAVTRQADGAAAPADEPSWIERALEQLADDKPSE